jgi:general secretion pathway protein G
MLHRLHGGRRRRAETAPSQGFTLIELLIMIVVLGLLAAVVIFALGGVQASSAASACNSDAKTVEIAVESFRANPENTAAPGQYPSTGVAGQAQLIAPSSAHYGGPYLRTWPSNTSHYTISLDPAVRGRVDVTPAGSGTPLDYDSTTNPCSEVS